LFVLSDYFLVLFVRLMQGGREATQTNEIAAENERKDTHRHARAQEMSIKSTNKSKEKERKKIGISSFIFWLVLENRQ